MLQVLKSFPLGTGILGKKGDHTWCSLRILPYEQCSKPRLVDDDRGLYYPSYWGLYCNNNPIGESLLTNEYNGMIDGFCGHCSYVSQQKSPGIAHIATKAPQTAPKKRPWDSGLGAGVSL